MGALKFSTNVGRIPIKLAVFDIHVTVWKERENNMRIIVNKIFLKFYLGKSSKGTPLQVELLLATNFPPCQSFEWWKLL